MKKVFAYLTLMSLMFLIMLPILIFDSCNTPKSKFEDDQVLYIKTQELNTVSTYNGKYKYTVYIEGHGDFYYYSSKKFTVGDTLDFEIKDNYILP